MSADASVGGGSISTHVLDTSLGMPAAGITVRLERDGALVAAGATDGDGRVREWSAPVSLDTGAYTLRFRVTEYFEASSRESFYEEIAVDFVVRDAAAKYHVPLLLNPFGYATYRGS